MRAQLAVPWLVACGCAAHFPLPMTAEELVQYDSAPALVAYLGQPDASPTVCDLRANGPHVPALNAKLSAALVDGLVEGSVPPPLWRRCVDVLLKGASAEDAATLVDDVARADWQVLTDSDLQETMALQERAGALHRLYLERPPGVNGHAAVVGPMFDDLRVAVAKAKLQPVALRLGKELLATVDVERGVWEGHPVDAAMMDSLAAQGNEMTLTRFVDRLPSPDARRDAKRRVIRVHIALSPFPEVKSAAPAVEEAVLAHGHNRLSLADHPLARAWLDPEKVLIRGVLVTQKVWDGSAKLLGYGGDRPGVSVLPELALGGALWAQVQAVSLPVTLCSPARDLSPSPCLSAEDVSIQNPLAYLDRGGAFHFTDHVAMLAAVALARGERFSLPLFVGGQPAVSFDWGLTFEQPEDLVFVGLGPGANGPDVDVSVERGPSGRYVFGANPADSNPGSYLAVVEARDISSYQVGSRGAEGHTGAVGSSGYDGADGSNGFDASCPYSSGTNGSNGGSGGNGGDGGPGGHGGNGGDVRVTFGCEGADCELSQAELRRIVSSAAGAGGVGGSGGRGGRGGRGGSGGSGATCTDNNGNSTSLSGGSSGFNGSDGSSGADGPPGRPGRPGRVRFSPAQGGGQ